MAKKKTVEVSSPETEASAELYYKFIAQNGDIYLTINAGRGSEVKVMSGEPTPPPKPPKG